MFGKALSQAPLGQHQQSQSSQGLKEYKNIFGKILVFWKSEHHNKDTEINPRLHHSRLWGTSHRRAISNSLPLDWKMRMYLIPGTSKRLSRNRRIFHTKLCLKTNKWFETMSWAHHFILVNSGQSLERGGDAFGGIAPRREEIDYNQSKPFAKPTLFRDLCSLRIGFEGIPGRKRTDAIHECS